jgi:hypothetical protein
VAVEETGGPKIPFRVGRSDEPDGSTSPPDGRLPDADKGSHVATRQHIRDIFYRMGTSTRVTNCVCLISSHNSLFCLSQASMIKKLSHYVEPTPWVVVTRIGRDIGDRGRTPKIPSRMNTFVFWWKNVGVPRSLTMANRGRDRISTKMRRGIS